MALSLPSSIGDAFRSHMRIAYVLLAVLTPFFLPFLILCIPLLILFLAASLPLLVPLLVLYKAKSLIQLPSWGFRNKDVEWEPVGLKEISPSEVNEEKRLLRGTLQSFEEEDGGHVQSVATSDLGSPEDMYSAEDICSAASSDGALFREEIPDEEEELGKRDKSEGRDMEDSQEGLGMPDYQVAAREVEHLVTPYVITDVQEESPFSSSSDDQSLASLPSSTEEQGEILQEQLAASESGFPELMTSLPSATEEQGESLQEQIAASESDFPESMASLPSATDKQDETLQKQLAASESGFPESMASLPSATDKKDETLQEQLAALESGFPDSMASLPSTTEKREILQEQLAALESGFPDSMASLPSATEQQTGPLQEQVATSEREVPEATAELDEMMENPVEDENVAMDRQTSHVPGHEPSDSELDKPEPWDLPSSSEEKDVSENPRPEDFGMEQKKIDGWQCSPGMAAADSEAYPQSAPAEWGDSTESTSSTTSP